METLQLLFEGFGNALTPENILMTAGGGILGILVGAMPGIGSLLGCALLLPLTFKMDPTSAIIMLAAIYYGNMYGGGYSAILLNIPGDSPAIMTAMDGYPLMRKGYPGKALFTTNMASFCGGTIGILILTFLGVGLADIGLLFGPSEMVAVMVLSLSSISWLLGDSPTKGLISTMLGIMIATIGTDGATGMPRFTFGNISLLSGVLLVPLVIGVFGFSQVMQMSHAKETDYTELKSTKLRIRDAVITKKEAKYCAPIVLRSGVVGTVVGILPGSGATIAAFLCYLMNKKVSKRGKEFGTGIPDGIAASEAANNAAAAGAFAPLLALGIPGSGTAAVLLSGPEDLAAHAGRLAKIAGGSRMMGLVTGSGCMLSALLGAFCAAEPDPFRAAVAASSFWKACAQEAWERSGQAGGGPGTLHACLFDAAWKIREWRETIEFF